MRVFILDSFVKTVGWQNYLILPCFSNEKRFSNKKEYRSFEIAATHAGLSNVQVGIATKLFVLTFDSTRDWRSVPVVSWTRAWKSFSDAAIRLWEMHVLYNPDGVVKYSKCWSCNAALFITYYACACRWCWSR